MKLPEEFTAYTHQLMGEELFNSYLHGMEEEAPTSIRLNPFKCFPIKAKVTNEDKEETADSVNLVPWCPTTGRYLPCRRNFTFDPLLHAGMYYVQEASSMFIDQVIRQYIQTPVRMLDLCAAPGGKSTAIRAALPEGSLLFSNEPMRTRSQILAENLQKFGHPDIIVTNNYPKDYKKSKIQFDAILTDVPCSGEGMFRKDEGAIKEWSPANVNKCAQLQKEIVEDIWSCLRPGGILVYSTCTFNAHEDEENIDWIVENLGAEILPVPIDSTWGITSSLINEEQMYHFIPGKVKGEGLFLTVLRKPGDSEPTLSTKGKEKKKKKESGKRERPICPDNWLQDHDSWSYYNTEKGIYAMKVQWLESLKAAQKSLKVIHAGIKIGTLKGKDIIPDQSLALSTALNTSVFNCEELTYDNAIKYLRKETIQLSNNAPIGYVLVTYKHIPLGWCKHLGNRSNNLYPQEWKIKSSHIPEGNNDIISFSN